MEDSKFLPQSRKRPLEQTSGNAQDSPYYKVRAVLKDLRPHFIEVLKTPDFRNCKAASEIREGMKLLIDYYKDMITEAIKLEAHNNTPVRPFPSISNGPRPSDHYHNVKPAVGSAQNGAPIQLSGHQAQGTYIVGGSAFGWNFITFNSNKAAYYGRTKEDFRAANAKPTEVGTIDP